MEVEQTHNGIVIVTMPPRLDAAGVATVEQQLADTIAQHEGSKVLVDMAQVSFVASLALRMLLTNLKMAQLHEGGDLSLSGLQPQIADVFRKSRFETLFKIYPDRAAALAAYTT